MDITALRAFFCVIVDLLLLFFALCNMHMTNVIFNITYVIIAHKPLDFFLKTAMIGGGRGK